MNLEPLLASYLGVSSKKEPIHAVAEVLPSTSEEKAEVLVCVEN